MYFSLRFYWDLFLKHESLCVIPFSSSKATVSITWRDWRDDLAGVKEYDLEVRQLSGLHGATMTEIFDSAAVYSDLANSGHRVTFPDVGEYQLAALP